MASLEVREHFADYLDTIAGIVEPVPIDQDEDEEEDDDDGSPDEEEDNNNGTAGTIR